jgi:hypothetical protein
MAITTAITATPTMAMTRAAVVVSMRTIVDVKARRFKAKCQKLEIRGQNVLL